MTMTGVVRRWTRSRRAAELLVACVAGLLATLVLAASAAADYELAAEWEFDSPVAIAVHGESVFVAKNAASGCGVSRFTTEGDLATSFSDRVGCPFGAATTPQGNLVVTVGSQLRYFDANGNFQRAATITNSSGEVFLNDVDIDPKGDQYVSVLGSTIDDYPPAIVRFSASGQLLAAWDGGGSGNGQFGNSPISIASDGRGSVYVADDGNYRLQRFTDAGAYVTQWGQLGTEPGRFLSANGVAVDDRGDVYVADGTGNGRIQKFDPSGKLLDIIDIPAFVHANPVDLDIDRQGNVYVADNGNPEAVYVFRPGDACAKAKKKVGKAKKKLKKAKRQGADAKKLKKAKKKLKKAKKAKKRVC
jgi:streptogramin lyase